MKADTDETIVRKLRERSRSEAASWQLMTSWRVKKLPGGDGECVHGASALRRWKLPESSWMECNRDVPLLKQAREQSSFSPEIISRQHLMIACSNMKMLRWVGAGLEWVQAEVDLQRGCGTPVFSRRFKHAVNICTLKNTHLTFNLQQIHAATPTLVSSSAASRC